MTRLLDIFNFFEQLYILTGTAHWLVGRKMKTDFVNALKISKQANMYAYDAYFLDCAIRQKAPLLTLDREPKTAAQKLKVETMEV